MYDVQKIKTWIKKAVKRTGVSGRFVYDPVQELVSDGCAVFRVTPEMLPTLMEVFGHLKGGTFVGGDYREDVFNMTGFTELPKETYKLTDSQLRFVSCKKEFRVLYQSGSGAKVILDEKYVDLIQGFETMELHTEDIGKPKPVHVLSGTNWLGTILPIVGLDHLALLNNLEFIVARSVEDAEESESNRVAIQL